MSNLESLPSSGYELRGRKLKAAIPEVAIANFVIAAESFRATLVHPESGFGGMLRFAAGQQQAKPVLSQTDHPLLFSVLEHGGNVFEGYFYPFLIFHGLNLTFANRLSERTKTVTALGLTTFALFFADGGIRPGVEADWADMPAGLVSMAAWVGSRRLFRNLELQSANIPRPQLTANQKQEVVQRLKRRKKHRKSH